MAARTMEAVSLSIDYIKLASIPIHCTNISKKFVHAYIHIRSNNLIHVHMHVYIIIYTHTTK